jgi:hypothetical protein
MVEGIALHEAFQEVDTLLDKSRRTVSKEKA